MARHGAAREDIGMRSFATLGLAPVRRWIWLPAAVCLAAAARFEGAGPARALHRRARVHHHVQLAGHRDRPDLSRVPYQRHV
jgi:hypothetical protein